MKFHCRRFVGSDEILAKNTPINPFTCALRPVFNDFPGARSMTRCSMDALAPYIAGIRFVTPNVGVDDWEGQVHPATPAPLVISMSESISRLDMVVPTLTSARRISMIRAGHALYRTLCVHSVRVLYAFEMCLRTGRLEAPGFVVEQRVIQPLDARIGFLSDFCYIHSCGIAGGPEPSHGFGAEIVRKYALYDANAVLRSFAESMAVATAAIDDAPRITLMRTDKLKIDRAANNIFLTITPGMARSFAISMCSMRMGGRSAQFEIAIATTEVLALFGPIGGVCQFLLSKPYMFTPEAEIIIFGEIAKILGTPANPVTGTVLRHAVLADPAVPSMAMRGLFANIRSLITDPGSRMVAIGDLGVAWATKLCNIVHEAYWQTTSPQALFPLRDLYAIPVHIDITRACMQHYPTDPLGRTNDWNSRRSQHDIRKAIAAYNMSGGNARAGDSVMLMGDPAATRVPGIVGASHVSHYSYVTPAMLQGRRAAVNVTPEIVPGIARWHVDQFLEALALLDTITTGHGGLGPAIALSASAQQLGIGRMFTTIDTTAALSDVTGRPFVSGLQPEGSVGNVPVGKLEYMSAFAAIVHGVRGKPVQIAGSEAYGLPVPVRTRNMPTTYSNYHFYYDECAVMRFMVSVSHVLWHPERMGEAVHDYMKCVFDGIDKQTQLARIALRVQSATVRTLVAGAAQIRSDISVFDMYDPVLAGTQLFPFDAQRRMYASPRGPLTQHPTHAIVDGAVMGPEAGLLGIYLFKELTEACLFMPGLSTSGAAASVGLAHQIAHDRGDFIVGAPSNQDAFTHLKSVAVDLPTPLLNTTERTFTTQYGLRAHWLRSREPVLALGGAQMVFMREIMLALREVSASHEGSIKLTYSSCMELLDRMRPLVRQANREATILNPGHVPYTVPVGVMIFGRITPVFTAYDPDPGTHVFMPTPDVEVVFDEVIDGVIKTVAHATVVVHTMKIDHVRACTGVLSRVQVMIPQLRTNDALYNTAAVDALAANMNMPATYGYVRQDQLHLGRVSVPLRAVLLPSLGVTVPVQYPDNAHAAVLGDMMVRADPTALGYGLPVRFGFDDALTANPFNDVNINIYGGVAARAGVPADIWGGVDPLSVDDICLYPIATSCAEDIMVSMEDAVIVPAQGPVPAFYY